ncbi:MAG TPA: hypothetical protein VKP88_01085 [Candidatus Paceibacterota bacterium]|nr:hypothetical protein [Candidatus Paceibacterota bacterium]
MIAEELKIQIRAETAKAVQDLKKAEGASNNATKSFRSMALSLAKAAAPIAAAAVGFRALSRAVGESIQLANAQEEAEQSLNAALISTGRQSEISAQAIRTLASELQGVTTFGDEATIQAAALTQQLADLNEKQLKEAIPAVQDFASALGIDLDSAAQLVGKSIGSTTNALTRYGVEIDNSLRGSERADAVITALNEKFGGFSQEIADTASGSLQQFNNALGDFKEIGGQTITGFLQPVTTALTNYITRLNETISAKRT